MLVLTRKPQETICIGDQVTISILRVKGRAVRVGIEAPNNVRVVRGELVDGAAKSDETCETSMGEPDTREKTASVRPAPLRQLTTQRVNQLLALRRREKSQEALLAAS
jgi:carbon storage regulator CsrA